MNSIKLKIKEIPLLIILTISISFTSSSFAFPTEDTLETMPDGPYPSQSFINRLQSAIKNKDQTNEASVSDETIIIIIPNESEIQINEDTQANVTIIVQNDDENQSTADETNKILSTPKNISEINRGGTTHGLKAK